MVGNLTQAQADAVRKHITDLVFATFLTTRRKLGECELQKKKFTRAMQQELLQAEGRKAADILAMIENIGNGGEPPAPQEIGQAATAEASQRDSQAPAEAAPPAHVGQARIVRGRGPRGRGGRRGNPLAIRPVGGTAKK